MDQQKVKNIVEGALLAAAKPLNVNQLQNLFDIADQEQPTRDQIRQAIKELEKEYETKAIELKQVGNGFRIHVGQEYEPWISRLWEEKPPRYSRALLETLAIIAYRQPITRGEIEEIRGVSVSTNITKTLQEREWVKVVGHRDVPGKPAMFGTTKEFLDYFNLKNLESLPTLAELKDIDSIHPELDLEDDKPAKSIEAGEAVESDDAEETVAIETESNVVEMHPESAETVH